MRRQGDEEERRGGDEHRNATAYRWGAAIASRPRSILLLCLLAVALGAVLYPTLRGALSAPDYQVSGAESTRVQGLLARIPGQGAEQDVVVFRSGALEVGDRRYRAAVARVLAAVRRQHGVVGVIGPYSKRARGQVSRDGRSALAVLALAGNGRERADLADALQDAAQGEAGGGVGAWITGYSPVSNDLTRVEDSDIERAEAIGIPVALLVLLLALGAFGAALVPLAIAASGLLLTYGILAGLATFFHFDALLLTIVTMIGVGIGIDYSLFIVSRFREELAHADGGDRRSRVRAAVGEATATSGTTILTSGTIVALSLCSLLVIDSPIFREIAIGTVAAVIGTLAAALILLPALLALVGERLSWGSLPTRWQPPDTRHEGEVERSGWARWAMFVMRRPLACALVPTVALLIAIVPVLGLRYGIDLGLTSVADTPSGKGAAVLASSCAPGDVSPVKVLVQGRGERPLGDREVARATRLARELRRDPRVAGVRAERAGGRLLITAVPSVAIDSPAASALVRRNRRGLAPSVQVDGAPEVLVGGATAQFVDLSAETRAKLPLVIGLVLGAALIFLLLAFRSLLLPLKAVLMNLLATGATVGLVVLAFQNGLGESPFGFTSPGYIQVYLPLSVFVLLFGLSMDYEVFLVGRMKEVWERTGDNRLAVASGLRHTARPITAAAAIMVAVFGSFLTADVLELKQFGFALAAGIAIDATLIRMILVPALMRCFGPWNWWLPAPIERLLPERSGAEAPSPTRS
jgi:RND superfamily putative drug exporter